MGYSRLDLEEGEIFTKAAAYDFWVSRGTGLRTFSFTPAELNTSLHEVFRNWGEGGEGMSTVTLAMRGRLRGLFADQPLGTFLNVLQKQNGDLTKMPRMSRDGKVGAKTIRIFFDNMLTVKEIPVERVEAEKVELSVTDFSDEELATPMHVVMLQWGGGENLMPMRMRMSLLHILAPKGGTLQGFLEEYASDGILNEDKIRALRNVGALGVQYLKMVLDLRMVSADRVALMLEGTNKQVMAILEEGAGALLPVGLKSYLSMRLGELVDAEVAAKCAQLRGEALEVLDQS
ncbi:hypothetical protein COY06_04350 [Candidatus Peregrinibacteria bacterium CG_4_10_14_0_2_um_filter_41_8]|nr:MAG: hypothetical protein COY06_04350 [Candidatus Peregrinibacteria bacterium CG_4_10_14_0_2_um_filter_41_8]